jgi:outer membrane protein assembly factor BamB
LGISAILSCFDAHTGELKWQKSFGDIDTSTIYCGTSASPIIDGKNVIVQVGDNHRGNIIAFDVITGKQKWQWNGSSVAYASPIIAELEGVRQVVAHTNEALVGVDVNNGQLLWTMPFMESKYRENIVSPVQAGELLIISNGDEGANAIRPSKKDGKWNLHKVWQNSDIAMYMSTPVIHGDYLFGMSDKRKGMFFCLKTATGEVLWRTKGDEGENAAILHSKDVLFFLMNDANLKIIRKDPTKYEQLATYQIADAQTWSHPVIWENQILIKDQSNLSLWSIQ